MKHRLFTTAAALSLLLCLACVVMWVRSGFAYDEAGTSTSASTVDGWMLFSNKGTLIFRISRWGLPARVGKLTFYVYVQDGWRAPVGWHWLLPTYRSMTLPPPPDRARSPEPASIREFVLPYWLLTGTSACLPAFWFWQWRREKRRQRRGFEVQPATEKK